MKISEIIAAEHQAGRVFRTVRQFASDSETLNALRNAEQILSEVRHFAAYVADVRRMQATTRDLGRDDAHDLIAEAAQRLTQFCTPDA